MRTKYAVLLMVFFVAPVSIPQAGPSFEVISIKASRLGDQVVHARCRGTDGEMMLGSATTFVPGGYIAPGTGKMRSSRCHGENDRWGGIRASREQTH